MGNERKRTKRKEWTGERRERGEERK
jgi:hypothetical protein